jgi:iron-sulfur cluster assembly accessory protein
MFVCVRYFFVVILALACLSSGCGEREHAPSPDAISPTPAEVPSAPDVIPPTRDIVRSARPSDDIISTPDTVSPTSADVATAPTQQSELVKVTEKAATMLRSMGRKYRLGEDFYLRLVVKPGGPAGFSYDLNITKKVNAATDVFVESRGMHVVVDRASLPFVRGGTVDFATSGENAGFQFHKPAGLRDIAKPEARTAALSKPDPALNNSRRRAPRVATKRHGTAFSASDTGTATLSGTYSNIHAEDYVGPQACGKCHTEQYDMWRNHPHSKMNRNSGLETVMGDFSGTSVDYADGSVVFDREDDDFIMTVFHKGVFARRYKVTRTVGSRIFQMYIGVQIEGPEPPEDSIYTEERKLPFAYWIQRNQWFPEIYDEPIARPEYDTAGQLTDAYVFHTRNSRPIWQESCLWCHNTYPYEARLQKQLTGFPSRDVTLTRISHPVPRGQTANSHAFPPSELVTLGISCESCHFGGREHAIENREIRFLPTSEDLRFPKATAHLVKNARKSPYVTNGICAQCHAVLQPKYPNLAATWNSSEALDLQSGACTSEIRCIDCHNPHQAGPPRGGGPDRPEHVEACLRCHEKYRAPDAAAAHTRHPLSSQVSCLDCHMPRIVHGLHDVTRTHQISSPTDPRMLSKGAPNACNLCHLDRSIRWTLDELETGWGRRVEPSDSWKRWYGGTLDGPTGLMWLRHQAPMARQAAADAYSRSPLGKAALPRILQILNDDNPPTRMFGLFATERILGRQLESQEYSPWSSPTERKRQIEALAY